MREMEVLVARLRGPSAALDWEGWRVFGDWLLEQGDARGELVALAHQARAPGLSPEVAARVMQRAADLEEMHRQEWLGGYVVPPNAQLQWQFGFVTGLRLHLHPDPLGVLEGLCARVQPLFLTAVELSECRLSDAPSWPLRGLLHLSLRKCALGPSGAAHLARSEALRGLLRLDLYRNALGDEGVRALAGSEALTSLLELDLQSNALGPESAASLAHAPALGSLQRLNLRSNHLGDEGAASLAHATTLRSLQHLDLDSNALGPSAARSLAHARGLPQLTALDLGRNAVGDEGALALAEAEGLRSLNLWANELREEGKKAVGTMRQRGCRVEW
jgi:hypothetical protein